MGKLFSPGKLLLTSEYVVLDGALALAVPTKWGQEFFFEEVEDEKSLIFWEAFHQGKPWLQIEIDYQKDEIIQTNIPESALFILKVIKTIQQLSTIRFQRNTSYQLKTNLQFPSDFGLGSSSTLMNNLAEWSEIDAFLLNELSLGGSGYDIAIAKEKSAILYQNSLNEKMIQKIDFNPSFKDQLIFIHLNQKQDSREGIRLYKSKQKSQKLVNFFSNLTKEVVSCGDLGEFSELMYVHEEQIKNFLEIETIKEKYFENCPVFVKSLGAWGGDFVMSRKFPGFRSYFLEHGFPTIFEWDDLIV